jgi:DNA-directed RNA polymerase I, II, and III subunit RPABC4
MCVCLAGKSPTYLLPPVQLLCPLSVAITILLSSRPRNYHLLQCHIIIIMNATTTAAGAGTNGATTIPSGIPLSRGVEYRCGDCGAKNLIKGGDPVRCRQCGFRILYKTRTKRCECYNVRDEALCTHNIIIL